MDEEIRTQAESLHKRQLHDELDSLAPLDPYLMSQM